MYIIHFFQKKIYQIIFFLVFFLIGVFVHKDYGISIDEEFQRSSGFYWLNYVLNFTSFDGLKEDVVNKIAQIKGFTLPSVEGNQFYGVIFDLPAAFLEVIFKVEDSKNYYYFKHFLNFLLFFCCFYLFL